MTAVVWLHCQNRAKSKPPADTEVVWSGWRMHQPLFTLPGFHCTYLLTYMQHIFMTGPYFYFMKKTSFFCATINSNYKPSFPSQFPPENETTVLPMYLTVSGIEGGM